MKQTLKQQVLLAALGIGCLAVTGYALAYMMLLAALLTV